MKGNLGKFFVLLILVAVIGAFFFFDLKQYLTLESLKQNKETISAFYVENQFYTIAIYFLVYVTVAALSLPGASVLTLMGGALFGLVTGTIVVSFASSIGATFAFLASRYLLGNYVQEKFGDKLKVINKGVEKEGAFYLFTMRLTPVFPFFMVNLVMGLTPIKTVTYYIVSQLGMILGTIVYVNAGTQLSKIDSLTGILSPNLLISFVLLGVFPLVSKKIVEFVKGKKVPEEKPVN